MRPQRQLETSEQYAARVRNRAIRLKLRLNARHAAASDDYLNGEPSGPWHAPNNRAVWVTRAPNPDRKHRATGNAKGRKPSRDVGLADAVHGLMESHGITMIEARREIAGLLEKTEGITFKSAMDRVLKALRAPTGAREKDCKA
jgi:hypothetical protein